MLRRLVVASSAVLLCAVPVATAVAQGVSNIPGLTVSFTQPTGTGTTLSSFQVIIQLSMASGFAPFVFDGSDVADNFGLPTTFPEPTSGMLNSDGTGDFAFVPATPGGPLYTSAFLNIGFECSDSFTTDCGGGPYTADANFASPTLNSLGSLTIANGSPLNFLFYTFNPTAAVTPGTYTYFNAVVDVGFQGQDADGDAIFQYETLGDTCDNDNASCAFTRDVTAAPVTSTPEPATFGLFGLGLGVLEVVRRRRRRI